MDLLRHTNYDSEIKDANYGLNNTAFMEPLAIRMGYWGQSGGREMRLLFNMQAQAKGYKYLTSFALRDVISSRIQEKRADGICKTIRSRTLGLLSYVSL